MSVAPSSAATAATPIASATALPLGSGAAPVSRPPNGILAAGEADAILKRGEARRVTLLDPGSEPREVVAYRIAPGATQKVSFALELAMAMNPAGARPKLTKMPRTETTLELVADAADDKGFFPVRAKVVSIVLVETDPSQARSLAASKELLAKLEGVTLRTSVDARGNRTAVVADARSDGPDLATALDQLKQSLENVTTPMPAEAVGVGAKWVVVERLTTATDVIQVRTVTLKKRDGKRIDLDVRIDQVAASDQLPRTGPALGAPPKLASLETSGTATFAIDLERVCPDKGRSDVSTVMLLSASGDTLRTEAAARAFIESQ